MVRGPGFEPGQAFASGVLLGGASASRWVLEAFIPSPGGAPGS